MRDLTAPPFRQATPTMIRVWLEGKAFFYFTRNLDETVLALQEGRFMLLNVANMRAGKREVGKAIYLNPAFVNTLYEVSINPETGREDEDAATE